MGRGRLIRVGAFRKRMIYLGLITLGVVFLSVTLIYLEKREKDILAEKKAETARLEHLIAEEEKRTETIADYRAYVQTKSYIEEIARKVLGLVYKDEIIFRPVTEIAPTGDEVVVPKDR